MTTKHTPIHKKTPAPKLPDIVVSDGTEGAEQQAPQMFPVADSTMSGGRPGLANLAETPNLQDGRIPYETHTAIHLNSEHADAYLHDSVGFPTTAGFQMNIDDHIHAKAGYEMLISVDTASIPATFYNITSKNGRFSYSEEMTFETMSELSFDLEYGNYGSPVDLAYEITGNLNALSPYGLLYGVAYSAKTKKVSITVSRAGAIDPSATYNIIFHFANTGSIGPVLGFPDSVEHFVGPGTHITVAPRIVNLRHLHNVYIKTNFGIPNVIHPRTGGRTDILAKVHITDAVYASQGIQYFDNSSADFKAPVQSGSITSIVMELVDEAGDLIDLNGADWSCTLQVTHRRIW